MAEPEVDEPDTMQAFADAHIKAMAGIATMGFEKAQSLCDESLTTIRKHSGLRSKIVDNAMAALGIGETDETKPGENNDQKS